MKLSALFVTCGVVLALGIVATPRDAEAERSAPHTSSLSKSDVTIYAATWCPACRALESGLRERNVPFDVVDVEKSPQAFERARTEAKAGSAIPLTGVVKGSDTSWIVGADIEAVERLYRASH